MSKGPGKERGMAKGNKIVIRAKRGKPTMVRVRLEGPTTLEEGRTLAAKLNAIIAQFNTLYFKRKDGTEILPKITATTETDT